MIIVLLIISIISLVALVMACLAFSRTFKNKRESTVWTSPEDKKSFGFIIQRHVTANEHDKLWVEAYTCIRKLYNNMIVIIDDNSNYDYVSDIQLKNAKVLQSEFKGSAEVGAYYYYLLYKWFDTAIIISDGTFIQERFNMDITNYAPLLSFPSSVAPSPENTKRLIKKLDNHEDLLVLYEQENLWNGIFAGMCIIDHAFLKKCDKKHTLLKLVKAIKTRADRMSWERILGCILISNFKKIKAKFGDMFPDFPATNSKGEPWDTCISVNGSKPNFETYLKELKYNKKFPICRVGFAR